MNILFLTEAYPPAPVVGSFRAAKVAREFNRQGHCVHIMTMRGGGPEEQPAGEVAPGITWERISPWPGPRQAFLAAKRMLRRGAASSDGAQAADEGGEAAASNGRASLRQILSGLITLPDDRQGFVPAAMAAARRRRGWADIIYATSPCFSVLLAGRMLHGMLDVPWFAELRDPWIGNAARQRHEHTPLVGSLDRFLERFSLRTARGIVMVTPGAAEEYAGRFGMQGVPVFHALNGIDQVTQLPPEARAVTGTLRIVYAGSVYPPRNPAPLVRALGAAYGDLTDAPAVQLTFVGASGWHEAPGLDDEVRALPPGITVERLSWIPQVDARRLMGEAHLLLLPAQQWRLQIPNKLYDYLGSRVPIFAVVERGSDTERMLQTAGGSQVAYSDSDDAELKVTAARALRSAMAGERAGKTDILAGWTTDAQMADLVNRVVAQVTSGSLVPAEPRVLQGAPR